MTGLALALIACFVAGAVASVWFRAKTARLARERKCTEIKQFVDHFNQAGIPVEVSTAVYQYLIDLPWMHRLPVDPKDELLDVYRIAGEELAEAYESILATTGRDLPDDRRGDALLVASVEDMVNFIAELPSKRAPLV
jgi:hypothetical protein